MLYQINKGTKSFGANIVFKNIQFEIRNTEKIAIVGRNGCGKTTLLKVINNSETLDEGTIHKSSEVTIGYLAQTTFTDLDRTVREELLSVFQQVIELEKRLKEVELRMKSDHSEEILNTYANFQHRYEEMDGYRYVTEIKTVFTKFGFHESELDRTIATFSGGQKTKIAFVKLLLSKPDILLLDEPTNHLDLRTIEWLEGYLKFYPKAVVLVSHDRMFLDEVADVVYDMEFGQLTRYSGNYTNFVAMKKLQQEKQLQAYNHQQKDIERLEALIEKFRYKKNKAAFAQSKIKYLDRMEKIESPTSDIKNFHAHFQPKIKGGKKVLTLLDYTVGYDKPLCSLSVTILSQNRVAILGPNGQGKSTLLKTIMGQLEPLAGSMLLGHQIDIGYFDQEMAQINSDKTVLEELWDDFPELDRTAIRTTLGNFLFSNDDVFKSVSVLSGGEKVRLCLAKLMLRKANFLILDEPTNHLDILGKEALEEALSDYTGTILFVSHDRYFIRKLATAIIEIDDGEATYYSLNYDEYHQKTAEEENKTIEVKEMKRKKPRPKPVNRDKEIEKIERKIDEQETLLLELRERRFEPTYYHDYQKMNALNEEIDDVCVKIDALMRQWEKLQEE